ncbi:MAG: alpha/beta fold hydrolase [Dehalococcoidia bacterium]
MPVAPVGHEIRRRTVETNGIKMHIAEAGEGPLVVMCHGWPESWYSWRHQLIALAAAGYHAVAPDQRGYGQTDKPREIDKYTVLHLVGDIVGLLDALGEKTAVIAGHDWGAPVAWNSALLRPDRFRGVVGLSVPYTPRGPVTITQAMRAAGAKNFYMLYFQEPGVAEAEFERDVRTTMRKVLYAASGDAPRTGELGGFVPEGGMLAASPDPQTLPAWLTEADIDFYTGEFQKSGFRGGLNWYRNIDRTNELMAPWNGAPVTAPALFMAGTRDIVMSFPGVKERVAAGGLKEFIPNLRTSVLLPDCGHWTQQERPIEVNAAMIEFLNGL